MSDRKQLELRRSAHCYLQSEANFWKEKIRGKLSEGGGTTLPMHGKASSGRSTELASPSARLIKRLLNLFKSELCSRQTGNRRNLQKGGVNFFS